METIIQQIATKLTEEILKRVKEAGLNLNELTEFALKKCKEAAREIVQTCAEEVNQQIRSDKAWRKGQGLVLKEKARQRKILSCLGEVELSRDYYYDQKKERYVTPLDEAMGIERYERLLPSIGVELVTQATEQSYARSAEIVTGGAVSRQTVRNQILKLHVPEKEAEAPRRAVKELHLFADEDHVHMQKPKKEKGKKSQIVPLVTVTEGIGEDEGRRRTLKPMSFVDEEFDTKRLWESVSGYIGRAYDIENLERICIHADGGNWIKKGLEEYAQTVHIMDGFHFERALKRVSNLFAGKNVRKRIHEAIQKDDKKQADAVIQRLMEDEKDEKRVKRVKEFGVYLLSHWEEIRRRRTEDVPGSCTEGQVSHLLSKRFSRNPMGWSKVGLGKLSGARIYLKNGGKLTIQDLREQREEQEGTYSAYAERMLSESLAGAENWSIFSQKEIVAFDQTSGTQHLLHQLGTPRSLLN